MFCDSPKHCCNQTKIISIDISDGELYSGTVADFSASDSLIIKNVTSAKYWNERLTNLRTEKYDFKQLNGKYKASIN